ncbi:MAG: AI-2E family transporter, partial [Ruminococcus sp.]|nr:AI-2E family transporter [Ruminococcus sp.]
MKKLLNLRNVLIAIAFTVFLLLVKDNMNVVWDIIGKILGILSPFFLGFLIAYILNFPYKFFYTKLFRKMGIKHTFWQRFKKPLSIICTYIIFFAVVAALIGIVVPQIAANISTLYEHMPEYVQTGYQYISQLFDFLNTHLHTHLNLDATVQEAYNQITNLVQNLDFAKTADATKNVLGIVSVFLLNTVSGLYNFIMALIISIYFLASKEQLCRQVKKMTVAVVPMKYLPRLYEIVDVTDTKCGRFLVGDIIDAGLIGILIYITMSIFHLPYAPMIAVLVGVTNIIPFFGPFIGGVPSALILFLVDPMDMIWFVIILVVIQQLDGNVFKPKIIGNQLGISGFWVLFSVIVGGALFGIPGF